jgi:hypothetical protein
LKLIKDTKVIQHGTQSMKAVGPVSFSNIHGTYTRMKRLEELVSAVFLQFRVCIQTLLDTWIDTEP